MEAEGSREATQVLFSDAARARLLAGMQGANAAVGSTLGPKGLTVLISRAGEPPIATKDGVTVSRAICPLDPFERMGADLIKEAAGRTNDVAGDGTTTATVLTYAMVSDSNRMIAAGHSPVAIKRGIERATSDVVGVLRNCSRELTSQSEIAQVGTVSANGDDRIGQLLADAMARVGRDGIISVEDAKGTVTSLELVEGMQFERGYLSPYFVNNNDRMQALYDDGYVLLTDGKLTSLQELVNILELVLREKKPLLIIADEIEGAALQTLIVNKVRSGLNVVAIKAPGYGATRDAFLADIAILTGGRVASPTTGITIEKMTRADLGRCKRFVVDTKSTTIVGTGTTATAVNEHVSSLREQLSDPTHSPNEALKLRERIARLASGVAVVKVGGATELEMVERKHRIEDALHATRAAVEEGILPGGGTALARAAWIVACGTSSKPASQLSELAASELAGYSIVLRACEAPLRRIVENAGVPADVVVQELKNAQTADDDSFSHGYDAATGTYGDLVEKGILDPLKVTRTALVNAASVACTFTMLSSAIAAANSN